MAFVSSLQKEQITVGCELCKGQNKIQFKCIDCELLMCCECLDGIHLRIAKDHQITDIKDIGKHVIFSEIKCENHTGQACCLFCETCKTFICPKCVAKVHNGHELIEEEDYNEGKVEKKPKQQGKIKFEIAKEYTTDLTSILYIAVCSDGSMWMWDNSNRKLQHVKLIEDKTAVITSLNIKIYGLAKTDSNNILVTTGETKLKLINTMTGQMTDSRYDVKPLYPIGIHVTSDHRVIIGAYPGGNKVPVTGRCVVVVMNQEGNLLKVYEHDNHNKRLLTFPTCVTATSNGNICVVDVIDNDDRGRVIVLSPGGDILGTYNGYPDVNTGDKPLQPGRILATPSDNIIVTDTFSSSLHILTSQGQIITYYNLHDMGISYPCPLVLSTTGTIYIACANAEGSPDTTKAKLYELNYSGF